MFEKKVFISHSSKNKEIADHLCAFISRLGVHNKNIFCSSVLGQGLVNGEKLNDAIAKALKESKLLLFLISKSFIESSYCLEELGAGWFLAHQKKVTCYYLILPDIDLSELTGFVNSKIDKFSFIDPTQKDDLGMIAENLIKALKLKQMQFTEIANIGNSFFSSTDKYIANLIQDKTLVEQGKLAETQKINSLAEEIQHKNVQIEALKERVGKLNDEKRDELLRVELKTLNNHFCYLGYFSGISQSLYKQLRKNFWFSFVNRYKEILALLHKEPHYDYIELLIGTIYTANNDLDKAYPHIKNFVALCESHVTISNLAEFLNVYNGSMREIIDILIEKAAKEHEGVVKDSYLETIKALEDREIKVGNM